MIVLDASALIAHFDARDAHHERATELIAGSGAELLAASTITLAETLVAPARTGRLAAAEAALERLGVGEVVFGEDAPGRLAQLRAETARKLPDCCVILAAQETQGAVASFDGALRATAAELGLETLPSELG